MHITLIGYEKMLFKCGQTVVFHQINFAKQGNGFPIRYEEGINV